VVGGQRLAPAALPQRRRSVSTVQEAGSAPWRSWQMQRSENLLPPLGFKTRSVQIIIATPSRPLLRLLCWLNQGRRDQHKMWRTWFLSDNNISAQESEGKNPSIRTGIIQNMTLHIRMKTSWLASSVSAYTPVAIYNNVYWLQVGRHPVAVVI